MSDAPQAFETTCLPFLPDCYAFALSLTRRSHEAEDLVQDTFLKAQRAFASFTPGTNAKAWLFTILRRLHIDAYRRGRLRPTPRPQDELTEMAPAAAVESAEDPDDLPWDHLAPGAVEAAIDGVPEPFRMPVRLRDLDGFSYREIGEILDVPSGTVMSRLHRGREYVRQALVSQSERQGAPGQAPDAALPPEGTG
jgi:RNA polymerase sigma-70 factor (ECF subfamily)